MAENISNVDLSDFQALQDTEVDSVRFTLNEMPEGKEPFGFSYHTLNNNEPNTNGNYIGFTISRGNKLIKFCHCISI